MDRYQKLVEELRGRVKVCERLGNESKKEAARRHFYGVALGYGIAAKELEELLLQAPPLDEESIEKIGNKKEVKSG